MNLTAVKVAVQFILSLFEEIRTTGNGIMYLFCYLPRVNTAVLRHYDIIDWSCNKMDNANLFRMSKYHIQLIF